MKEIKNEYFDIERALYNLKDTKLINCRFEGVNDGESVLKEARNIKLDGCYFNLRYPLWHVKTLEANDSYFEDNSRAPIWYTANGTFNRCHFNSIKAVRECENITMNDCDITSDEFGWKSNYVILNNCVINSVYIFFDSKNLNLKNVKFQGKYSFQYDDNIIIEDSYLDTKDAFWHSKNVIVKNSIVKGEYLGWFSENIQFINCKIIGTQPLCFCKKLRLIDCEMIDCDLSFEYSDVDATIKGSITSIKNPKSGKIIADEIKEIIYEDSLVENNCIILQNKN